MMKTTLFVKTIGAALLTMLMALPAMAGSVDINRADAGTIASELQGIGPAKAKAIVDYRTKNGAFKSVDDLRKVRGISDKLLAKIRANIIVNSAGENAKKAS